MNRSWLRSLLLASAAAAVLSACGGDSHNSGGGAASDNGSDLPASATSSSAAFMAYLVTLVATGSDTAEPLNLGTATIPADDNGDSVVN